MKFKYFIPALALLLACSEKKPVVEESVIKSDSDSLELRAYESFQQTDIFAYSKASLNPTRNQIFGGGLPICWKEVGKVLNCYPIPLNDGPVWLKEFSNEAISYKDIDSSSIRIQIAPGEAIDKNRSPIAQPMEPNEHSLTVLVEIRKELEFVDQISFSDEYDYFPDYSFGNKKVKYNYFWGSSTQDILAYELYDYKSDDDFILKFPLKNSGTELIMACVSPGESLRETYEKVRVRMNVKKRVPLKYIDMIIFPTIQFFTERNYPELQHQVVGKDYEITSVKQSLKFVLDHMGLIIVETDVATADTTAAIPVEVKHDEPKRLFYDQPFLIIVKEKNSKEPFLLMWVGNDELMLKK